MWLDEALVADPRIELLPLSPRIALASVELEWNSADCFIVASAVTHAASLATADEPNNHLWARVNGCAS